MRDVVIVTVTAEAGGRAQLNPAGGFVTGANIALGIAKVSASSGPVPVRWAQCSGNAAPARPRTRLARQGWRNAERTRKRLFCTIKGSRRVRGSQPTNTSRAASFRAARPDEDREHLLAAHGQLHDIPIA